MSQSNDLDPLELWRKALSSLESNFNQMSSQALRTDEITQSMSRLSTAAVGLQSSWDQAVARYFKAMNMATRDEVMAIAAALQRVEEKLDRLLPAEVSTAPRPSRNRQPPAALVAAAAPTMSPVAAAASAAAVEAVVDEPAPQTARATRSAAARKTPARSSARKATPTRARRAKP